MKTKKNNIITYNKLAFFNAIIATILVTILYFALPKVLNYPSNTIDNDFQRKVVRNYLYFTIYNISYYNCIIYLFFCTPCIYKTLCWIIWYKRLNN